jgi:hypothetical protein
MDVFTVAVTDGRVTSTIFCAFAKLGKRRIVDKKKRKLIPPVQNDTLQFSGPLFKKKEKIDC